MKLPLLTLVLSASALHAQTCTPNGTQEAATETLALQQKLLQAPIADMDTEVPAALQPILHDFKQSLSNAADLHIRCLDASLTDPAQIQSALASALHANRPPPGKPGAAPAPNSGSVRNVYGADLSVTVKPVPAQPGLVSIQLTYDVQCGTDSILLIYRRAASGWRRELDLSSPDLKTVADARGDFFLFTLVPGGSSYPYLLAVAYGSPWCSSRWSGFHLDLVAPATAGQPEAFLSHLDDGYVRGDVEPKLRSTPDGFDLRLEVGSHDESALVRPGIFRFRTISGTLERIQPIAPNARGFVDAWLQLPWEQAAAWADQPTPALRSVHSRFSAKGDAAGPSLDFGPTRACSSAPQVFQVEIDLAEGSKLDRASTLYARVRQNPNSFTMLSISATPDPACAGPDLMKKH